jgi:hypothetical protein
VEMTGGAVVWRMQIPTAVRVHQIGFIHTTAAPGTRSADAVTWIAAVYPYGQSVQSNYIDAYTGVAGSRYVELGPTYTYPAPEFMFSADTTNTDRIYAWMDVEVIGESV